MAITFPGYSADSVEVEYFSSATDQAPLLGGPIKRIARMGDRFKYTVNLRPVKSWQAGALCAALIGGLTETIVIPIKETGVDLSAYSNGTVSGAATGRTLTHSGGGATKYVGQYFSLIKNGVRYLHRVTAVSGQVLTFLPMLKVPLTGGEVLEFGSPKIEGFVEGNSQRWTVGYVSNTKISFSIKEAR